MLMTYASRRGASYLLLFIPPHPLPLRHLLRSIHICMNLANSSLRIRRIPYVFACVQTCMLGQRVKAVQRLARVRELNVKPNSFLTRNYHALSRASSRASLTSFIRYYPDLRIDYRARRKNILYACIMSLTERSVHSTSSNKKSLLTSNAEEFSESSETKRTMLNS